ncbi:MAG TPA: hypothetical protein PKC69_06800 [Chitinophagaceae bacterium]|nr:hypothetical protein [Chitinophagaceae bacterium]
MKTILLLILLAVSAPGMYAQGGDPSVPFSEGTRERIEQNDDRSEQDQESTEAALEGLNDFFDIMRSIDDLYAASDALSRGECAPDFNTSGQAMMRSACAGNAACGECYTKAVNDLAFVRRQLGRMNCIYNNTKNFNDAAIAFGDNASGIHAVTGLSWQYARADIVKTFSHFKQTYDKKYTDMMQALNRALMAIDACEREFGEPDWYQRFGFIYFEFMKDKYRRTD